MTTAEPTVMPKKKRHRTPPLIPWKKPKDMPKRPLSAYNIFFREQREIMCKEGGVSRGASKSGKSPGIGFAGLAKTIAVKWKEIPDGSRTPYTAQAAIEKDRYNKEMVVWRAKQKEEKEKAEKEKAILPDDSQYTGVARREDSAACSPARVNSSEATETDVPRVAEAQRLSPSSYDQSSRSGLVARRRPEHEQFPPYGRSYRGVGSYADALGEEVRYYNPAIEYGHQEGEQQQYPARGGLLVGQDSYRAPWTEATHSSEVHQGFDRPVEVPRPNLQERHFSESSGTRAGSYPETWFEVQQPREAEIDDQGGGKWPATKSAPELSDPIASKHHAMRIRNVENPSRQLRAASAYSPILQHTNPDIDATRWRNTERAFSEHASSEPSLGMGRPSVGHQQEEGELAMHKFIDPFAEDLAQRRGQRGASSNDVARMTQTQSSLQQLGTRLDTEAVDFLTSLKFSPQGSSNSSEELHGS